MDKDSPVPIFLCMAIGIVFGGLFLGPFGAILGAVIGLATYMATGKDLSEDSEMSDVVDNTDIKK